jgi:hypothetical protein
MGDHVRQMYSPTAHEVLAVWERARKQSPDDRALTMLSYLAPQKSLTQLAHVPLGERDGALLELRRGMFGPVLSGYAPCPVCDEKLEFSFEPPRFQVPEEVDGTATHELVDGQYRIRYRAPNTADLQTVTASGYAGDVKHALLSQCALNVDRQGDTILPKEVPADLLERLEERLSKENAASDLRLDLVCANCGRSWEAPIDVATFLWAEWDTLARQLLRDTGTLARAFGWREADILAMSACRRQFYLDMVFS